MVRRKTLYQVLGVEPHMSSAEIKRAYRKLVKSLHPDLGHAEHTHAEKQAATERMMHINEAYETLMDGQKRSDYDVTIGISRRVAILQENAFNEDEAREKFLSQVYHPSRQSLGKVLARYKKELRELSLDIYDDKLLSAFEEYVDLVEDVLRQAADAFATNQSPRSLDSAVQMMRYSISQAADGLDEMRRFCQNFDYQHLSMAETLFRIATDLSKQSLRLARGL